LKGKGAEFHSHIEGGLTSPANFQSNSFLAAAGTRLGSWKKHESDPGQIFQDCRRQVMASELETKNRTLVLRAFDMLFDERDYATAEQFWSPQYIQHSAHIAPGREGLFDLIKGLPPTLKYEAGTIVAEGNFVIVHGRFSGFGAPVNWMLLTAYASRRDYPSNIGM
jgi:hypothetical protein